jgi:hypothetical protein
MTPATSTSCSGCEAGHEWVVYSTAVTEVWLMLQCVACGLVGTVEDPSKEEWSEAFHAPSSPYRWRDGSRVVEKAFAPLQINRGNSSTGIKHKSESAQA